MSKSYLKYLFRPDRLIKKIFERINFNDREKTVYLTAVNGDPLIYFDRNGNIIQTPAQKERYFNCAMFDFDQNAGKAFLFDVLEGKKDHIITEKGKESFLLKAKQILAQNGYLKFNNNLTDKIIIPFSGNEKERLESLILKNNKGV